MPIIAAISPPKFELANMPDLQSKDPALAPLIKYLQSGDLPGNSSDDRNISSIADQYTLQDNVLYHLYSPSTPYRRQETRCQLVVSRSCIDHVLMSMHDDIFSGHLGITKTYDKIRQRYHWEGMYKDVTHWISSCKDCASKKSPKRSMTAPMQSIPVEGPFDRVCVDVLGPLPTSDLGNRYVVVFTDSLTKWPEAFAIRNAGADAIAQLFVEEIVCRHGAPRTLLSDRGKNFLSKLVQEVCDLFSVKRSIPLPITLRQTVLRSDLTTRYATCSLCTCLNIKETGTALFLSRSLLIALQCRNLLRKLPSISSTVEIQLYR